VASTRSHFPAEFSENSAGKCDLDASCGVENARHGDLDESLLANVARGVAIWSVDGEFSGTGLSR